LAFLTVLLAFLATFLFAIRNLLETKAGVSRI